MKKIKMLAVTPYKGLGDFFLNCAKSFPQISVDIFIGNMLAAAQNLERYQGYDIVASRGGTAEILREKLLIPVIEVGVSVYDMLRVIKMAQKTGKKFAIVGFASLIKTSRLLRGILQYSFPTYTITSEEDAARVARRLAKEGMELVVGDVISTDHAAARNLPTILITSGVESVEQAFIDTERLFQNLESLRRLSPQVSRNIRPPRYDGAIKIENPGPALRHQASPPAFLDAERIRAALEKAAAAQTRLPMIILGKPGAGVPALARYIHTQGPFKNSPFITVDCRALTEKLWHDIVRHADSPLHALKCTIFLHDVHQLQYGLQKLLSGYMEDTLLTKRHQLIASSSADLARLAAGGDFSPDFYQKLNGLTLCLPALKERPEEIPALGNLFISHYNREFAKQIIGFEDEALEYLKAAPWELNLDQFQGVVRQLVIVAEKPYITLADVLNNLPAPQAAAADSLRIDLNKPFHEIEKEILRRVLEEENMNQSRAAKRLGLGRSTLWRKLSG